jgi:hypothetical protein
MEFRAFSIVPREGKYRWHLTCDDGTVLHGVAETFRCAFADAEDAHDAHVARWRGLPYFGGAR